MHCKQKQQEKPFSNQEIGWIHCKVANKDARGLNVAEVSKFSMIGENQFSEYILLLESEKN